MKWVIVGLFVAILGGCGSVPVPPPPTTVNCPVIKEYTPVQESDIAAILKPLPPDNPLRKAFDDYGKLRNQVRACQSVK